MWSVILTLTVAWLLTEFNKLLISYGFHTHITVYNSLWNLHRMVKKNNNTEWQDCRGKDLFMREERCEWPDGGCGNSNTHSLQLWWQKRFSECTTCRTFKQMGYNSWRPHWVPLLSEESKATVGTCSAKQENIVKS